MEAPSWAVVLPAYNAAEHIGDSIRSLLVQTEPPQQIIVCDDGSDDDITAAVAPFEDHVTLVRQPNRGPAAARNAGARLVETDWILFLDADDWVSEDLLERSRHTASSDAAVDLLAVDALGVDHRTRNVLYRHYERASFAHAQQRRAILEQNFLLTGVSVRRAAWARIGGFDESLPICEDWDCWMRMILSGSRVALLDGGLLFRRHHDHNLSSDRHGMLSGRLEVLRRVQQDPRLDHAERQVVAASIRTNQRALTHLQGTELLRAWRSGSDGSALRQRRAAVRLMTSRGTTPKRRTVLAAGAIAPRAVGRLLRVLPPRPWALEQAHAARIGPSDGGDDTAVDAG